MNSNTLVSQRCHIAFFGRTNAGKSSVVNAISNQNLSIVSEIKGTTTDVVKKTMEILPLGAVVLIDTAGYDDTSLIGEKRIEKTLEVLNKIDVAIVVVDASLGLEVQDREFIQKLKTKNIPYLVVYNKSDISKSNQEGIYVSAKTKEGIEELKEKIAQFALQNKTPEKFIIKDKINPKDTVVLVIPIDEAAPKGRLILPQQNTLRELLDYHIKVICVQPDELKEVIENFKTSIKLIITDSQVFNKIKDIVPKDIFLTSFSILFARYKGNLGYLIEGVKQIENLKDNDTILISEGCTHHRQCNDIGSVKIPKWLQEYTGKKLNFEFTSGGDFPKNFDKYSLVIHCGGCMLNVKEMENRINIVQQNKVKIVNYGVLIAFLNGILKRSIQIFKEYQL